MSKKIIENLNKEIKSLMNKDFGLRKSLERVEKDLTVDNIEIEKLKKEKLKIKDKILAKQNELKLALDKIEQIKKTRRSRKYVLKKGKDC